MESFELGQLDNFYLYDAHPEYVKKRRPSNDVKSSGERPLHSGVLNKYLTSFCHSSRNRKNEANHRLPWPLMDIATAKIPVEYFHFVLIIHFTGRVRVIPVVVYSIVSCHGVINLLHSTLHSHDSVYFQGHGMALLSLVVAFDLYSTFTLLT